MSEINKITIVLVDDHALVRDGIKSILHSDPHLEVIAEANGGQQAIALIAKLKPHVAIVDINMPEVSGIQAIRELNKLKLSTRYVVLSMHDSKEYVLDSIKAGAHGYLLKDIEKEEFIKAIHAVGNGEQYYSADISSIVVNRYLDIVNQKPISKAMTESQVITPKEKEILELALGGSSNREIAQILHKSVRTVETQRFNLMKKLDAHNVAELYLKVQELGIL